MASGDEREREREERRGSERTSSLPVILISRYPKLRRTAHRTTSAPPIVSLTPEDRSSRSPEFEQGPRKRGGVSMRVSAESHVKARFRTPFDAREQFPFSRRQVSIALERLSVRWHSCRGKEEMPKTVSCSCETRTTAALSSGARFRRTRFKGPAKLP